MTDWPATKTLVVEQLLSKARERLVTIANDASLIQAAALFRTGIELVIVCDAAGLLAGVITKTDIVMSAFQGISTTTAVTLPATPKRAF